MPKIKPILFVPFLLLYIYSGAQSNKTFEKLYPEANAVTLRNLCFAKIQEKEGVLNIVYSVYDKKRILKNPNSNNYWVETVFYNTLERCGNYETIVTDPTDFKIRKEGYKAELETAFSKSEIYSDIKKQNFYFDEVVPGREITVQYDRTINNPFLLPIFYFNTEYPTIESTFKLTVGKGIEIGWIYFGPDSVDYKVTTTELDGAKIYIITVDSLLPVKEESNSYTYKEMAPHIIPYIKSFTYQGKTTRYLETPRDLHTWYRSMINRTNFKNQESVKKIAHQISDTCDSREEKTKAIFEWVQANIKYINSNAGLGGFIPNDAVDVLKNRYGDCKAMTNLTYHLLKHAGIESFYSWIGTIDLPYTYEGNPTPSVDNHMILAFEGENGDYQILDATNSYGSFYDTPYYLQGKETLISLSDSTFVIKKIPLDTYEDNMVIDSNYLFIENNIAKTHAQHSFTGSHKYITEDGFPLVRDEIIDYVKDNFLMANKKTKIDNVSFSGIKDRSNFMELRYDYTLYNHLVNANDKMYINLNLDQPLIRFDVDINKRKTDYFFEFPSTYKYICVYQIPEGYQLDYLPSDKEFDYEDFKLAIKYVQEEGKIIYNREIFIKNKKIQAKDFEEWNRFIGVLKESYTDVVAVKK